MPTKRRKVEGVEGEGLDDAELNAPPSPATKVRARRELLEICREHCPWNVLAVEELLAKAERELAEASDGKQLRLPVPPNPPRDAEQLAFPFPAKFSPSPAGEGESGSCGRRAKRARSAQGPSGGAVRRSRCGGAL